jgi:adenosine kinase
VQISSPSGKSTQTANPGSWVLIHHRDQALLQKYGLKANDAILADEKHLGIYDDLIENHAAALSAGGGAQNTARGAQVRSDRVIFPAALLTMPIG